MIIFYNEIMRMGYCFLFLGFGIYDKEGLDCFWEFLS